MIPDIKDLRIGGGDKSSPVFNEIKRIIIGIIKVCFLILMVSLAPMIILSIIVLLYGKRFTSELEISNLDLPRNRHGISFMNGIY